MRLRPVPSRRALKARAGGEAEEEEDGEAAEAEAAEEEFEDEDAEGSPLRLPRLRETAERQSPEPGRSRAPWP